MRQVNLRAIDLNLLVILETLLDEAHVSQAAQRLGMSQPAVSRALARLRRLLNDPLLVRSNVGLTLTPRARQLQTKLGVVLAGARNLVTPEMFDPALSKGVFTIAASDHQTVLLLPTVLSRLAKEAPNLNIRVIPLGRETIHDIALGKIDIALTVDQSRLPPDFHQDRLFKDRFVTLLRRGHPAIATWSLDKYLDLSHVLVTINDDGAGAIDSVLNQSKKARRIALRIPHFLAAMSIVSASDLCITVPETIARHFAERFSLQVLEVPVKRPGFAIVSVWSDISHADQAHRFLRQIVREAAAAIRLVS
jgi:DNA-binding transcriptional LysR family regulator